MRTKHPDRIGKYIAPLPRFAAGMLMLPPFLFTDGLAGKAVLALFFAILAVSAGKHLRWGYFLIVVLSVTFFHILSPWGRVLLEIGPLTITTGALESGLIRGITLIGMVFLSVAAVRPELKFPGRFGGLLGRTFYYFDVIIEGRKRLSRKNFFTSLDDLLTERFNPEKEGFGILEGGEVPAAERAFRGWIPAAAAVLLTWALWFRAVLMV